VESFANLPQNGQLHCSTTNTNFMAQYKHTYNFKHIGIWETMMEFLEGTAYTIKKINAMNIFTVAAFCSLKQPSEVQEVWKTVFINVDTLYCIDKTSSEGIFNVLYITQMHAFTNVLVHDTNLLCKQLQQNC